VTAATHFYEVRPRKDKRGFDLISDALSFGRLWYAEPNAISNAVGYAKFYSRSHDAVIHVFDESGTVIERTSTLAIFRSRERRMAYTVKWNTGRSLLTRSLRPVGRGATALSPPQVNCIYIVDAHCGDGRRFIVESDQLLTAFLELEAILLLKLS
jgi:hypothetical protein